MFPRGVTVFAITGHGVETAAKIRNILNEQCINCEVFVSKKYSTQKGVTAIKGKLGERVKQVFSNTDAIVAVMATGITVRTIAPLLKSKMYDPAVVCVDVSGKYVISLLSGHYGGANELTKLVALGLGAIPVITTASDILGKQSIDELARKMHCTIVNPESLVTVNSALVNGKKLAVVMVGNIRVSLDHNEDYTIKTAENMEQAIKIANSFDAGAIISSEPLLKNGLLKHVTFLKPKTIVVGIGSRKDAKTEDIVETVKDALKHVCIPLWRVNRLATVEIKKDSQSMLHAAKSLGLNLEFVSLGELGAFSHVDLSVDSKIVKEKIGVGGVCEQAALITAGKNAKLLLKKTKSKTVTVAVARGE